eukprot:357824_1
MSSTQEYKHKVLTLKCCIDSNTQNSVNIKIPSKHDWDKNMKSLLSKIPKKFKFLSAMNDSEWSLSINDKIIDKHDAKQFGKILSTIAPIVIIRIIKTRSNENRSIITVHFDGKQFDYQLPQNKEDWNQYIYNDLQAIIRKTFDLNEEFNLYEDIDGSKVDVDDMDDICSGFDDSDNDEKQENNARSTKKKVLHLFVKTTNLFKIIYETQSFYWIPPKFDGDDEKQWNDNYNILINKIKKQYNMNQDDIQLQ